MRTGTADMSQLGYGDTPPFPPVLQQNLTEHTCAHANPPDTSLVFAPDQCRLVGPSATHARAQADGVTIATQDGLALLRQDHTEANFHTRMRRGRNEPWVHFDYLSHDGETRGLWDKPWSIAGTDQTPVASRQEVASPRPRQDSRVLLFAAPRDVAGPLPVSNVTVAAGGYPTCSFFEGLAGPGSLQTWSSSPDVAWSLSSTHLYCLAPPTGGATREAEVDFGACPPCQHGRCVGPAQCLCNDGWGGAVCNQSRPTGWISRAPVATGASVTCPSPLDYDVCGGRGVCRVRNTTDGHHTVAQCLCHQHWFGNASWLAVYMSSLVLHGSAETWTDPDGYWAAYAREHQCLFWEGTSVGNHTGYEFRGPGAGGVSHDSVVQPAYPWACADHRLEAPDARVNETAGGLYGGPRCEPCPNCSWAGTESCGLEDEQDPDSGLVCRCRPNYHGLACELQSCPMHEGLICGGKGQCYPEVPSAASTLPLNRTSMLPTLQQWSIEVNGWGDPLVSHSPSHTGVCSCQAGWGGTEGKCHRSLCPVDVHTHQVCGTHGRCVRANCSTVEMGVWEAFTAPQQAQCLSECVAGCTQDTGCDCSRRCAHGGRVVARNVTRGTHCNTGSCVCDPGWALDAQGLCNRRQCRLDAQGLECGGRRVNASNPLVGVHEHGQVVCDGDEFNPVCQCWKTVATPYAVIHATGYANGPRGACDIPHSAAGVCRPPNSAAGVPLCSGRGQCMIRGCPVDATDWRNCSDADRRNEPPQCVCDATSYGDHCEFSLCGEASSGAPCSLNHNRTIMTGTCEPGENGGAPTCKCFVTPSAAYMGANCQHDVTSACAPTHAGSHELCNGHGTCGFFNNTDAFACLCQSGYTGSRCEAETGCQGFCNHTRGTCREGVCECGYSWGGTNCTVDLCALYGVARLDRDHCNCSAIGAEMYPDPSRDRHPFDTFRGCRKRCPIDALGVECGGLSVGNYSRCDHLVPANATGSPMCNCSVPNDRNPYTGTASTFLTLADGTCQPRCTHCTEVGGLCQISSESQWQGPFCNESRCTRPGSQWNGTHCQCDGPGWLYTPHGDCEHGVSVCGPAPYGQAPRDPNAAHCTCHYPYRVDLDPQSTTFRHCVSACGPYGAPVGSQCLCHAAVTGVYCNETLCQPPYTPVDNGTACDCRDSYQWGGTHCNVSQCVGGVAKTGYGPGGHLDVGCSCYPHFEGVLCHIHRCHHGTPGAGPTAGCICEPGWSGPNCQMNMCGVDGLVDPVPTGVGTGYTCPCGPASVFDGTECVDVTCAHGRLLPLVNRSGLVCQCEPGWQGVHCDTRTCESLEQQPQNCSDLSEGCVCKDEEINDGEGVCEARLTCDEFLETHREWQESTVQLAGFTFVTSNVSVPVQAPVYDSVFSSVCMCNDTRYQPLSYYGTFVGCALVCTVQQLNDTLLSSSTERVYADQCPCDTEGWGGTQCGGFYLSADTQLPWTPPPVYGGPSSLSWQGWLIFAVVVVPMWATVVFFRPCQYCARAKETDVL